MGEAKVPDALVDVEDGARRWFAEQVHVVAEALGDAGSPAAGQHISTRRSSIYFGGSASLHPRFLQARRPLLAGYFEDRCSMQNNGRSDR